MKSWGDPGLFQMGVSTNKWGEILALQQLLRFPTGKRGARLPFLVFKAAVKFLDKLYSTKLSFLQEDSEFDQH